MFDIIKETLISEKEFTELIIKDYQSFGLHGK